MIVEDDHVRAKVLDTPILLRMQQLADQREAVGVRNVQEDDRQVSRFAEDASDPKTRDARRSKSIA